MMDSLTRFAMAQREVGLSVGEPPATKGYSALGLRPAAEAAGADGAGGQGSITGLYTVLVEGDDLNEPIADAVRSILDGHIVLSRTIAARPLSGRGCPHEHQPVMPEVVNASTAPPPPGHHRLLYRSAEDLINIGAYVAGSSPEIDHALKMIDRVNAYLRQDMNEKVGLRGEPQAAAGALPVSTQRAAFRQPGGKHIDCEVRKIGRAEERSGRRSLPHAFLSDMRLNQHVPVPL